LVEKCSDRKTGSIKKIGNLEAHRKPGDIARRRDKGASRGKTSAVPERLVKGFLNRKRMKRRLAKGV